jgi:hypothetical protein
VSASLSVSRGHVGYSQQAPAFYVFNARIIRDRLRIVNHISLDFS